jgi:hypothetical protein
VNVRLLLLLCFEQLDFVLGLGLRPPFPSREQFCGKKCKHRKGNCLKAKAETYLNGPKVQAREVFEQWVKDGKENRTVEEVEKRRHEIIAKFGMGGEWESKLRL